MGAWFAAALLAVDFASQVKPVLEQACLGCHGPERSYGNLRVDSGAAIARVVTASAPEKSPLLIRAMLPPSKAGAMPPGGPALTSAQLAALRAWIAEGARWPDGVTLSAPKRGADDEQLSARLHARIAAAPKPELAFYKQTIPGTDVVFEMAAIPAGEFLQGTPETEKGRRKDEGPQRKVRVEAFWMGAREVTWDEYRLWMFARDQGDALVDAVSRPTRPYVEMSFGMGINGFPAISMTHHAASKYAEWLSARTGHFYRLPTEAEWEYACRAGRTEEGPVEDRAWFEDNANGKYQLVGKKKPNAFGLYDMLGNVTEWTLDQYLADAYSRVDSLPWVKSATPYPHVARGGSWNDNALGCRCGARTASDASWKMQDPNLPKSIWYHTDAQWVGFRLVRPVRTPAAAEMHAYWNNGVAAE